MYTKYQYKNVEWVGPPSGLDYSEYNITQTLTKSRHATHAFIETKKGENHVISSMYMSQEDVPSIFGPPQSYKKCFITIMQYVCDEIEVSKNEDASAMVKCCLECHKICPYF